MTQGEHDKMLAIECLRLARAAPNPTDKARLTERAEAWRTLAAKAVQRKP